MQGRSLMYVISQDQIILSETYIWSYTMIPSNETATCSSNNKVSQIYISWLW